MTLSDGKVTTAEAFQPANRRPFHTAPAFLRASQELLAPFNQALRELRLSGE